MIIIDYHHRYQCHCYHYHPVRVLSGVHPDNHQHSNGLERVWLVELQLAFKFYSPTISSIPPGFASSSLLKVDKIHQMELQLAFLVFHL